MDAFDFVGTSLAGATETPAMPPPRTRKETLSPTQPLPPSLPSMLGHRRRASQATDVYKTYLPGRCPAAQRPDDGNVQESEGGSTQEFQQYELRRTCVLSVSPLLRQKSRK